MTLGPSDSVRRMLSRAIQIELRNGHLYDSLAGIFEGYDDEVQGAFREMAAEESRHAAELKARFRTLFGPIPPLSDEPKEVIEAADLEEPEALIFNSMTFEKALEAGLRAERKAQEFYEKEMLAAPDPELRQLYRELAQFEENHVRLLQGKLLAERRRVASSTLIRP